MIHQTFDDCLNQGARQASCGGSLSGLMVEDLETRKTSKETRGHGKLSKPMYLGSDAHM